MKLEYASKTSSIWFSFSHICAIVVAYARETEATLCQAGEPIVQCACVVTTVQWHGELQPGDTGNS